MKSNGSMNRLYRVIWNATTGAWQAVAEIAKGHGRSQSSGSGVVVIAQAPFCLRRSTLSLAVMAALATPAGQALAETGLGGSANLANSAASIVSATPLAVTEALGGGDSEVAYGIQAGDLLTNASITNNSSITVTNNVGDTVSGIGVDNLYGTSSIQNSTGASITVNTTRTGATDLTPDANTYTVASGIYAVSSNGGSITNAGTITVNATATGGDIGDLTESNARAAGILFDSGLTNATITNTGSIVATANAVANNTDQDGNNNSFTKAYSYAFGVRAGNLTNTTITNSNSITVTSTASAAAESSYYSYTTSNAYGINVGGMTASAITNTSDGLIEVQSSRKAIGIYADDALQSGSSISNAGTITVTSTGDDASGIDVAGDLEGLSSISNAGAINVSTSSRDAYGILVDASLDTGSFIRNTGTITVTSSDDSAYGIYVDANVLGGSSISNTGTITVTATSGDAYGIYVGGDLVGASSISNSGTISVTGSDGARGIFVGGDGLYGSSVTNSGQITVTSSGGSVKGIRISGYLAEDSGVESSVTNASTGVITLNGAADEDAYGIQVGQANNASTIVNAGTIRSLNTNMSTGNVYGIAVESLSDTASITNSGTITLANGNKTYGIKVDNSDATASINNSGTISVNANARAQGISIGNGSVEILNSGTITSTVNSKADALAWSIASLSAGVNVTNTSTGVLNGNLSIGGTMTNAGTISLPHNANTDQGGTSAEVGTFVNSGTLKIGLLTDGTTTTHSQLLANTATFNAGSKIAVNVMAASTNVGLLAGSTLNDVVKSTTLTLNATPIVTDNSALLDFKFVRDGNNIDLNVVEGQTIVEAVTPPAQPAQPAQPPINSNINTISAAVALQAIKDAGTSPNMDPVFSALNRLQTNQQVADAVSSFTPAATTASVSAGAQIANNVQSIVDLRQNVNFGGASGGLNSGDPLFADRNFWLKPFGTWGEQKDKSGLNGFDLKTRGIGFGLDGEYDNNKKLGLAFFYTNANVDVNNMAQKADIDVYSALLYGNMPVFDNMTNFLFQAGYSAQKTDTSRFIALTGDTATGDYTAKVASLDMKLVRDVQVSERFLLQPRVSVTYRHLTNPSYAENGAGALNQNVDSFTSSQTTLGIGTRMHYMVDDASKLMANVNYGRDMKSNALTVFTGFEGAPGVRYPSSGIDNGRNSYELGLGYERNVDKTSKLNVMYTHQGQGSSFNNNAISATYILKF